ncbi:MAG TPA: hypothetical protein VGC12_02505, partial [Methyloradius sp.]
AGKIKLSDSQKIYINTLLGVAEAAEKANLAAKTTKEINEYIAAGTVVRTEAAAQLAAEYTLYGKTSDARESALIGIKNEADAQREINAIKKAGQPIDEDQLQRIKDEAQARTDNAQAVAGQINALKYAQQLVDQSRKFSADLIFDDKQRNAALLQIEDETWQERIKLAGDGTEAQKKLIDAYSVYYAQQLNKPAIDEWRKSVSQYDDVFRKGFADMVNGGKSTWKSFTTSLVTTFKTTVADQIYKMFAQPFVVKLAASLLGITGTTGVANAATSSVVSAAGGTSGLGNIASIGKSIYDGLNGVQGSITGGIEKLGVFLANGNGGLVDQLGGFLGANASTIGSVLPYAGAALQLLQGNIKGAAFTAAGAAIGSIIPGIGTAIGAVVGSLIGSFVGGPASYNNATVSGSYSAGAYSRGSVTTNSRGDVATGALPTLDQLSAAFGARVGSLLTAFGLSDQQTFNTQVKFGKNLEAAFSANLASGGSAGIDGYGPKNYGGDAQAGLTRFISDVLSTGIKQAIASSNLADGIKSIFAQVTTETQVSNLITATLKLNSAQAELASRFGLTVDQAAQVSKATGLVGDDLVGFVSALGDTALGVRSQYQNLIDTRDALAAAIGQPLPSTLDAFDDLIKGIDKSTADGIAQTVTLLANRGAFTTYTNTIDGLKSGVSDSVLGLKSPTGQVDQLQAELAKMFDALDLAVPTSKDELLALGESIDYTTASGLALAAAFPNLVTQFDKTQTAIDGLSTSLDALNTD